MKLRKIFSLAIAAAVLAGTPALAQHKPLEGDPKELNFGIISTESSSHLRDAWEPFLQDMEKALRMKVKPFFATDYAGVIEAMRFGKVHVAWFGNKSAMEAVDRAGAEVFVQEIKADGTQGYYSHILTHVDNKEINSIEDLLARCNQSLNFGIGDPNSTSGFLVPSYYVFAQGNVDPKRCFKTVRNANHETNLMAVAHKQVDAATNNSEQIERSKKRAPEAARQIKVIWTSPLIPSDPITYRRDLSKGLKAKIKAFFLGYGRLGENVEYEKQVLDKLGTGGGGYTDSNNSQLYPIRQLNLFEQKLSLLKDSRLDPQERDRRVKKINDDLAELNILTKSM